MGPAFVAAVAYVDPGNVAANLAAGAGYGYLLVWVLVVANVVAMLVQYLSAKLGLVTGHSLRVVVVVWPSGFRPSLSLPPLIWRRSSVGRWPCSFCSGSH